MTTLPERPNALPYLLAIVTICGAVRACTSVVLDKRAAEREKHLQLRAE